jgi:hypothetical protein
MQKIERPLPGEYAPYTIAYISKVPEDGLIIEHLKANRIIVHDLIASLPEEKLNYRYAEGKWNLKEVMAHIIDTERVFNYRAFCIARKDQSMFPGFEQDDYVNASNAGSRTISSILNEYSIVRESSVVLFDSLEDTAWSRMGQANNNPVSVRALAYQTVGHELHHLNIIRDKYLQGSL